MLHSSLQCDPAVTHCQDVSHRGAKCADVAAPSPCANEAKLAVSAYS